MNYQSETVDEMNLRNICRTFHIMFSEQTFSSMHKQFSSEDHVIWLKINLNIEKLLKSYKIFSYDKQENIRKNKVTLEQSDSILNLFARKKSSKAFKNFFIQIKIE